MAAGKDVRELLLQVDASVELARRNISQLERSVAADSAKMDKSLGRIDGALGRVTGAFGKIAAVGATLGIGILSGGLMAAGRSALQFADDLSAAADQAGMSAERYQTLKEALRTLEVDGAKADKIFKMLQATLGDVQNGADNAATKALDRLGISARVMSGEITTSDQLLDALAEAAKRAGSQAQFTADIVDIFGKKVGVDLAAAIADGGAALHALEAGFKATGLVIDQEMIARLADANEAIDRFSVQASSGFAIFAAQAIEALSDVGGWLDELAVKLNNFGGNATSLYGPLSGIKSMIGGQDGAAATAARVNQRRVQETRDQTRASLTPTPQTALRPPAPKGGAKKPGKSRKSAAPKKVTQEDWIKSLSATDRIIFDANNMDVPVNGGRPLGEMVYDLEKAGKEASRLVEEMGSIPIPDLANMLTEEDAERIHNFAMSFKADLAGGLAEAIVYGDNLGDVLENTFKRAAAALLESGIMNILTGGKEGTSFGTLFSNIGSIFNLGKTPKPRAGGGPVAANDLYLVGERGPELFVPRLPGTIVPNGGGGGRGSPDVIRVVVDRSKYFDAHVNSISGRHVAAAAPAMIEGGGNVGKAKVLRAGQRRFP